MLQRNPTLAFFTITFGISWGLAAIFWILSSLGLEFLNGDQPGLFARGLFLLAVWGPNFSAVLVTWRIGGRDGLRDLFSRLSPRRAGAGWWTIAVVLPIALLAISVLLAKPFADVGFARLAPDSWTVLLTFLGLSLIGGPLGEELGWRGFALPRMAKRMTPLAATLLIGLAWGAWHLPVLVVPQIQQAFLPPGFPILAFPLYTTAASVLIGWIYLRGGQCLWLAVLFHLVLLWGVHALSRDPLPALVWGGVAAYFAAAILAALAPMMRKRGLGA
ncbi:CPBP family intramembrane glutamic endopeptidase [Falsiroseomonas tokyonensis]|uniref:CPBP family intramembrane glutamic endopeptidase n=1 Tax=Falsiroseomonas tokyonensis TaxID=430521 RepID=A0ABV7BPR5_9PROT|nr:type II CAAX endopeptidase family protein [Falsiroseomonas tokyonensis]MBU8536617.1 CPBP family intramembrane metalloprotease [Falsiroseomonas tokyonensis]